jgi:hypothetical protein
MMRKWSRFCLNKARFLISIVMSVMGAEIKRIFIYWSKKLVREMLRLEIVVP